MKIYKYKTLACIALLGLGLSSCSDYLDQPAKDNYNVSNFYQNDEQCRQGVDPIYNSPWYDFQRGFFKVGEVLSGNYYWGGSPYLTFTLTGSDADLANMSASLWSVNAYCNTVYDNINNSSGPSETVKNYCKGECLTWKAMAYFYLVRTFGAVMSTGDKGAGQVRGPIQITFSRSVEPVVISEHSITRMAVTNEKDVDKERTMGRKFTIPYGLYRAHGFVSPHLAGQTGFTQEDLNVFWDALLEMFELDHSAARGMMSARKLVIFEHKTALGSAPAHELFERVMCERVTDGPAREFKDYKITIDGEEIKEPKTIVNVGK